MIGDLKLFPLLGLRSSIRVTRSCSCSCSCPQARSRTLLSEASSLCAELLPALCWSRLVSACSSPLFSRLGQSWSAPSLLVEGADPAGVVQHNAWSTVLSRPSTSKLTRRGSTHPPRTVQTRPDLATRMSVLRVEPKSCVITSLGRHQSNSTVIPAEISPRSFSRTRRRRTMISTPS